MQVNLFNTIKDFFANLFKSRLIVLIAFFSVLSLVLIHRVFVLQIVNGEDYLENYTLSIRRTKEITGTRGNIYDRNGELLATNRLAYSIQIEDNGTYQNTSQKNKLINETLNQVIDMVESNGDSIITDFGIVINKDGEYEYLYAEGTKRLRFLADIYGYTKIDKLSKEERETTAEELMNFLCADKRKKDYGFGIDQENLEKERVLQLVTIRYGMHLNSFKKYIPTTIASDVSDETVAMIKENLYELQGISVGEEYLREYPEGKYFSSIIGYTGKISQDEYDALTEEQQKTYSKTDIVGKAGIEQVMDEYLQGTKGEQVVYVNTVGKIIESESVKEPKAGNDVYLTIDKELQITAYNLIEEKLAGIILRKLSNQLDYTRNPNGEASNVIIPIGDVYYSFIGNEILDTDEFAEEDATSTEKYVYSKFSTRLEASITKIVSHMNAPTAPSYGELPKEIQAYLNYIATELLTTKTGILMKDKIDVNDSVYTAWKAEEINLYEYLNHAISKNWVDSTVLQDYIDTDGKYSDSNELYQGIINFIKDYLQTDASFEKLVYKYMIKDGTVTGNQICILLYDQGVLEYDETQYNRLLSGYSSYDFIRTKINNLEITPGQLGVEPSTGSFVMTETATGNTLVCVSYPGYDNNRLANTMDTAYYNQMYVNTSMPFYNKATQEQTAPGSTFKPLSSITGLTEGVISSGTLVSCTGPYKNVTPNPKCWIYPGGHGSLNVVGAIANSCNNFFYDVGYRLGLTSNGTYSSQDGTDKIQKYAEMFGLGETSGLEITELSPHISDEDAVRSAIGQGTHIYTTSQLAKYITGVANKGTVYDLTLLSKVTDSEGKIIKEYEPTVYNEITEVDESTFNLVHEGMSQMVAKDSRFAKLREAGMTIAGKTGTAQQSNTHADHVLFVGFAPNVNPEIAFSCRIANGYSSGYTAELGRDMVLKYFNLADDSELLAGTAGMLGSESHGD